MDRLIPQSAIEAAIDARIDTANTLLDNPMCKGINRELAANTISVLMKVKADLAGIAA